MTQLTQQRTAKVLVLGDSGVVLQIFMLPLKEKTMLLELSGSLLHLRILLSRANPVLCTSSAIVTFCAERHPQ